jgi:hypothetical protein
MRVSKYNLGSLTEEEARAGFADLKGEMRIPEPRECGISFLTIMKEFYLQYYPEETARILKENARA